MDILNKPVLILKSKDRWQVRVMYGIIFPLNLVTNESRARLFITNFFLLQANMVGIFIAQFSVF